MVLKNLLAFSLSITFSTITASFLMALLAYILSLLGIARNPDCVTIGALMLLVPGLLFTNGMRDIIYGDVNSGINRIVEVLLIAVAIALGTASAWSVTANLLGTPVTVPDLVHPWPIMCLSTLVGCAGFTILFNIHGRGSILCVLGGMVTWIVYAIATEFTGQELMGFFWGSISASLSAEIMARIRKCPAICYLVVCIFPLIPGAGVYYTMNHAVQGNMTLFAEQGMYTAATAGLMAVGILLVSTVFRMWSMWLREHRKA